MIRLALVRLGTTTISRPWLFANASVLQRPQSSVGCKFSSLPTSNSRSISPWTEAAVRSINRTLETHALHSCLVFSLVKLVVLAPLAVTLCSLSVVGVLDFSLLASACVVSRLFRRIRLGAAMALAPSLQFYFPCLGRLKG